MTSHNRIFLFFGFSFLFGVFTNSVLEHFHLSLLVLLFIGVLFLNFYGYVKKYSLYILASLLGFFIGLVLVYFQLEGINQKQKFLSKYYNQKVYSQFEIINVNKIDTFSSEYKARLVSINESGVESFLKENSIYLLIDIPSNFRVENGDILESKEKFFEITNFDSGFNYQKYMLSKNIYFKMKVQSINRIDKKQRHALFIKIEKLRSLFLSTIHELYPKEEAIFLGGVLVGARENLPKELKDNFNNSGLTHFIAVSGFNITILIVFLTYLLKILPVVVRIICITTVIFLFTLLVGDTAPVIRASIMGLLVYYISISGREGDNLAIIIFTALVMICLSPLILVYDVSFHLSFLAVIGIIYTQDFFKKAFSFLPETLAIQEAFILTLSALSFSLPVMIFNFGQVSWLSPLANVAVTWTIPLVMLLGFLSIIVYFMSTTLGVGLAYITWVFLAWDIKIVHFFGELDWALLKFDFGIYKYSLEILYFLLLIFLVNYFKKKN